MYEITTLREGLLEELKGIYSAELHLVNALPKVERRVANVALKVALKEHIDRTTEQVTRLERIGELLNSPLSGGHCEAIEEIFEEETKVKHYDTTNAAVTDTVLIGATRRAGLYQAAAYSTTCAMARANEEFEVAAILEQSLNEQLDADKKFLTLLESRVLPMATLATIPRSETDSLIGIPHNTDQSVKRYAASIVLTITTWVATAVPGALSAYAETSYDRSVNEKRSTRYSAENTGRNIRDRNGNNLTADDQSLAGGDLAILARIRQELIANSELSTNAHNVKIVIEGRNVVLRGPVRTEGEKAWIFHRAAKVATGFSVVNQLEVASR